MRAAMLADAAMEVAFVKTVGQAEKIIVEQQADRAKQIRLARPVLAYDRVYTFFELHRSAGKVSVIDKLQFRYVHSSPKV